MVAIGGGSQNIRLRSHQIVRGWPLWIEAYGGVVATVPDGHQVWARVGLPLKNAPTLGMVIARLFAPVDGERQEVAL